MRFFIPSLASIVFALGPVSSVSRAADAAEDELLNNGEDITRPPARFDFRYRFEDKTDGVTQQTFILRRDQPFPLGDGWEIGTRIDLPLVLTDRKSADNPAGNSTFGTGDALVQTALIDNLTDRFAVASGARFVFPTANADQFGTGKYRLLPILGARWKLPELSAGSYFQFVTRYDFDMGGYGGRSHVSRVQLSPTLSIALPDRWFFTLCPSQDIAVNLLGGQKWFVPADCAIGRNLSERAVASLEVSVPIIKQYALYDFKLEARLGFKF